MKSNIEMFVTTNTVVNVVNSDIPEDSSCSANSTRITKTSIIYSNIIDSSVCLSPASLTNHIPQEGKVQIGNCSEQDRTFGLVCNGISNHAKQTGFRGRPALKQNSTLQTGNKAPQSQGTGTPNVLTTKCVPHLNWPGRSNDEIQLTLAGDSLGISSQGRGSGHLKPISKSSIKIPLGGNSSSSTKFNFCPVSFTSSQGRHCDACTVGCMRFCLKSPRQQETKEVHQASTESFEPEGQERIPGTSGVLPQDKRGVRSEKRFFYEPLQMLGKNGIMERNHLFMLMRDTKKANDYRMKREPAALHTVSLPKSGIIKLTGLTYELDNPQYYDNRKELLSKRELQKYKDEIFGSPLPQPSGDAHRGWLIRNKTMLKQVKNGEKWLLAEQEEQEYRRLNSQAILNTFVGGLLEYEMPEVPTMNSNLQKFIGMDSNNRGNNQQANSREKRPAQLSDYAHFTSRDSSGLSKLSITPANSPRISSGLRKPAITSANSPKLQLFPIDDQYHKTSKTKHKFTENLNSTVQEKESGPSLHQVITNAKKIHPYHIPDIYKPKSIEVPMSDSQY